MPELIAMLPSAIAAVQAIANLISELQASGTAPTAVQLATLNAAISQRQAAEVAFNAAVLAAGGTPAAP